MIIKPKAVDHPRAELAEIIQRFLCGPYDWDDFISFPVQDPALEDIRRQCEELPSRFPPTPKGGYCSEDGLSVLSDLLRECAPDEG